MHMRRQALLTIAVRLVVWMLIRHTGQKALCLINTTHGPFGWLIHELKLARY